jgi:hypothetical protein
MNSHSPFHSSSSEMVLKRFRLWKRQYLHIVIYTSLFWIFVDVFFIMLFSDCTKEIIVPCPATLSINSTSKMIEQNLPRHPKMILDQVKAPKESAVHKWWEVNPGLNVNFNQKKHVGLYNRSNKSTALGR